MNSQAGVRDQILILQRDWSYLNPQTEQFQRFAKTTSSQAEGIFQVYLVILLFRYDVPQNFG